jgi:L-aspartate oxidase
MVDAHPDAELAPRDVVARAVHRQLLDGARPLLDATRAIGPDFPDRFPTVFELASRHGIDPRTEPLPVAPAAHYTMGGVAVDGRGRTSLDGLWAVGEVSASGLHGANRLASNSLLEGLVMGRRAGQDVLAEAGTPPSSADAPVLLSSRVVDAMLSGAPRPGAGRAVEQQARSILWEAAGVVRHATGLEHGRRALDRLRAVDGEPANSVLVAKLVIEAAAERAESRGAHHRSDHPQSDPALASRVVRIPEPTDCHRWVITGDALAPQPRPSPAVLATRA